MPISGCMDKKLIMTGEHFFPAPVGRLFVLFGNGGWTLSANGGLCLQHVSVLGWLRREWLDLAGSARQSGNTSGKNGSVRFLLLSGLRLGIFAVGSILDGVGFLFRSVVDKVSEGILLSPV